MNFFLKCTFTVLAFFAFNNELAAANIGLLVTATGKYAEFVSPLIESARKHFCKNHRVTFFVFTDQELPCSADVISVFQSRRGWPNDSLMRGHSYYASREIFGNMDYLFACDADMLFVGDVGDEILSRHVAVVHPGFTDKRGSYESNPNSTAYVAPNEGRYYFCGGFYGGSKTQFLEMLGWIISKIDVDIQNGVMACWHDESHWNRYCIDHKPTLVLSPSYCYPESSKIKFPKKLLALDKNHSEFRK
jgi:histo-blood group ABO system transferase